MHDHIFFVKCMSHCDDYISFNGFFSLSECKVCIAFAKSACLSLFRLEILEEIAERIRMQGVH
jgi:hypothetical protein